MKDPDAVKLGKKSWAARKLSIENPSEYFKALRKKRKKKEVIAPEQ